MKKLKVSIKGTRDLIMHNGRLANPLDPWTRAVKAVIEKKDKTDKGLIELMRVEARASIYETEKKEVGLPAEIVYASILEAARVRKLGMKIERGVRYDPITEPLFINGKIFNADKFIEDPKNIYYVSVGNRGNRVMRSRPIIKGEWRADYEFELDQNILNIESFVEILVYAGPYIGLCDRRPLYGTYKGEVIK